MPWWVIKVLMGDPGRKVLMRGIRILLARNARTLWLAKYDMDSADEASCSRFLQRVERRMLTL